MGVDFETRVDIRRLHFGHGFGLALHEQPIVSRLVYFRGPCSARWILCVARSVRDPTQEIYTDTNF
jgi:hypothetical protein